jgi:arylsulfatase A-like enzyme
MSDMKVSKVIFALFLVALSCWYTFAQTVRPNVVFILIDDLGYGDLESYGNRFVKTPNLDNFAKQGIRFTQFYSASPLCSPSRAAFLTGRAPYRTGIKSWIPEGENIYLHKQEKTLASILKENGYQTFLSGKWHLNPGLHLANYPQPSDAGFDKWMALHAFPIPNSKHTTNFYDNGKAVGEIDGFAGDFAIDKAIEYLNARDKNKPFLLFLPLVEVHGVIASPDRFLKQYSKYTYQTNFKPFNNTNEGVDYGGFTARGPGEYYAQVAYMDFVVGRMLNYLKKSGLDENTIVFFASDNGPVTDQWRYSYELNLYGSAGGLRGRKADLYEGGIRVPAMIRYPSHVKAGTVSDVPLHGYDFMPTLLSMLNLPIPNDRVIDGQDFSTIFKNQPLKRSKPLFWAYETRFADTPEGFAYAAREGDWKIITDEAVEKAMLFNLKTDLYEVDDVSKKNPEVTEKLKAYIREMKKSIEQDPLRPSAGLKPYMMR